MNTEIARKRELWLRVFYHEISRRRRISNEKPKAYKKLFASNPKRLSEDPCEVHTWVPATTLWIHDNSKKGNLIDGFRRRGFHEAQMYKSSGYIVIPQICWSCTCTREKIVPDLSWAERQAILDKLSKEQYKGKPRGKLGGDSMLEDFEDLFL